jgi:hypothetical protein
MPRIALAILAPALALALAGCGNKGAAQSTPAGPSKMTPTLEIELFAEPAKLAMAQRALFKIGLRAVNRGAAPVDPQLHDAVLTANGQRVYAWDLAIQNGARDDSWTSLPPGKSIDMSWSLGEAIFEKPGKYQLALTLGGQTSSADVEVTP